MIRMVRSLMKIWLVTYMACGCVACRSNKKSHPLEGEVAVSVPCLRDMGIVRPIAGWSRGDSNMTRFKYRDGRIVGGYSTEYGTFIVETHPLAFRVFTKKKSVATGRVREVCFKPVRVAPEGHVVYMEFNGMEQETANGGKARPFRGEVSASYDSEGHITEMNYHRENSSGYRETGVARYTWKDGNLETVVSDVSHTNNLYERHEIYTFGYDMQDSLKLNPGIYLQEMNCFPGLYDFIWYAGLWGENHLSHSADGHIRKGGRRRKSQRNAIYHFYPQAGKECCDIVLRWSSALFIRLLSRQLPLSGGPVVGLGW